MSEARPTFGGSHTLEEFLGAMAARQPTPGGGSAAAMAGALAAAIGEMTLNYSVGRKDRAAADVKLKPVIAELQRARGMLLVLMVEDQQAYAAMTELHKLPADSKERIERTAAVVLTCIRVPEAIAAAGVAILELCERVVEMVNPRLLSDWAVCAELAMATVRCGMYNVKANLAEVKEAGDRAAIETAIGSMGSRAVGMIQRVMPRIWERHGEMVKG